MKTQQTQVPETSLEEPEPKVELRNLEVFKYSCSGITLKPAMDAGYKN